MFAKLFSTLDLQLIWVHINESKVFYEKRTTLKSFPPPFRIFTRVKKLILPQNFKRFLRFEQILLQMQAFLDL